MLGGGGIEHRADVRKLGARRAAERASCLLARLEPAPAGKVNDAAAAGKQVLLKKPREAAAYAAATAETTTNQASVHADVAQATAAAQRAVVALPHSQADSTL